MSKPLLVFDMDGVLVDVSESYRETIAQTAAFFIGEKPTPEHVQGFKLLGGFNDDWKLTHQIVSEAGVDVPFETVKERFQQIFLGDGTNGLILRERWIANPGVLEGLAERYQLAIFT